MIPCLYEPFKHWAGKGSVIILSDMHFNDPDCMRMAPEWIKAEEQISIINKMCTKNDTFICLGDVGDPSYMDKIRAGRKVLILGNHDAKGRVKPYFDEVYDGALFIADKILFSHEPVYGLPWCLNIHGHSHKGILEYVDEGGGKHLNLAADVCGYTPVNLKNLITAGMLSDIKNIHRLTINSAIERKEKFGDKDNIEVKNECDYAMDV